MNQILNHLSYSALAEFARCPRSWFAHRILGMSQVSGSAARFGHTFESVVTAELGAEVCPKRHEKTPKTPAAEKPIPEALLAAAMPAIEATNDAEQEEAKTAARVYFGSEGAVKPASPGHRVLAQREIWLEPEQFGMMADFYSVRADLHLPILGYIDLLLLDGPEGVKRTIVDLKTSTRAGNQAGWWMQLGLYALVERAQRVEAHLLIRPAPRDPDAPEPKRPTKPRPHRTAFYGVNPTPEFFSHVVTWIGAQAEGIRRATDSSVERLPACESFACSWCGLSGSCEAYQLAGIRPFGGTEICQEVVEGA